MRGVAEKLDLDVIRRSVLRKYTETVEAGCHLTAAQKTE